MMYEMKDEYLTGIKQIDDEHRKLFELTEEAYQLLKNEFITDKYDKIVEILEGLREYTKVHFAHEEEYMESIGYKKIFTQKIQHRDFIEKIDSIDLEHIDENQEKAIKDIIVFLGDWLVNHVLHTDKQIAEK